MDCLFCNIIQGEIPARVVYENDSVMAFLDIHPTTKGHTLVVPKAHYQDYMAADPATLSELATAAKKVAQAVMAATGSRGFNVNINNGSVAGQVIFHVHWHIIPRYEDDGLRLWPAGEGYGEGEMAELAGKIKKMID